MGGVKVMYCYFCMKEIEANTKKCPHCGNNQDIITPPHRLLPGTVLNERYVVGVAKGEGGFGITYIGLDKKLDRIVAIKEYYPTGYVNRSNTISPNVSEVTSEASDAFFRKGCDRFLREAKTIAKFSGEPGIVNVIDYFEENNTAYIIMEYLDGITLRDYLKQKEKLSVDETMRILRPIMLSLEKIHQQGLIHRDISPSNIMLVDGAVKLIDFGAARTASAEKNKSLSLMLKPGYAPEEQYRSKGVQGPWTDVYAICATIYKCITGVTPDEANDRLYTDELNNPSALGISVTPDFEYALMKGLAVLQKDRYQSIKDLMNGFDGNKVAADSDEITAISTSLRSDDECDTQYLPSQTEDDKVTMYQSKEDTVYSEDTRYLSEDDQESCYQPDSVVLGEKKNNESDNEVTDSVSVGIKQKDKIISNKPAVDDYLSKSVHGSKSEKDNDKSTNESKKTTNIKQRNNKKMIVIPVVVISLGIIALITGVVISNYYSPKTEFATTVSDYSSEIVFDFSVDNSDNSISDTSNSKYNTDSFYFSYEEVSTSIIEEMTNSSVSHIHMKDCTVEQGAIDALAELNGQLRTLELDGCAGFNDYSAISKISSLRSLSIINASISNEEFMGIKFNEFSDLNTLVLTNNQNLSDISPIKPLSETLTKLNIESCPISNISVLEDFEALIDLEASHCKIADISALSGKSLYRLILSDNELKDIAPLSGVTSLSVLVLSDNQIDSLKPISNNSKLKKLNVDHNKLKTLDGLEEILRLAVLSAVENQIETLDGLTNCTVLEKVYLCKNKLTDISILKKSSATLKVVDISDNNIQSLSALSNSFQLKYLFFDNNTVSSIDDLAASVNLYSISGENNQIQSIDVLKNMKDLHYLFLSKNIISDMTAIKNMDQESYILDLSNNNIKELALNSSSYYRCLMIQNNPLNNLKDTLSVNGHRIVFTYIDGTYLDSIGEHFNYSICVLDCPLDHQVAVENVVGHAVSFKITDEVNNYVEKMKTEVISSSDAYYDD